MVHSIELGGEMRYIRFGFTAFRLAKEKGIVLRDILHALTVNNDFTILAEMTYFALRSAEIANKSGLGKYTIDDVSEWMDSSPKNISVISKYLTDSIEAMTPAQNTDTAEPDGEGKKKAKK